MNSLIFEYTDKIILDGIPDINITENDDYIEATSKNISITNILKTFNLSPAVIELPISSKQIESCTFISEQLGGKFDPITGTDIILPYFVNDYYGIVKLHPNDICIAFGGPEILTPSINVQVIYKCTEYGNDIYLVFGTESRTVSVNTTNDAIYYPGNLREDFIFDILYMYPELKTINNKNFTMFTSQFLTHEQIKLIFESSQYSKYFPEVDNLVGGFAMWLLAEQTFYLYPLAWNTETLYIENVGYTQGNELFEIFEQLLETAKTYEYRLYNSFTNLAKLIQSQNEKVKGFYLNGQYYAAIPKDFIINKALINNTKLPEYSFYETLIEIKNPLRMIDYEYLSMLGYDTTHPEVVDLPFDIKLLTNITEDTTTYYYVTTAKTIQNIHTIKGAPKKIITLQLQLLLNNGYFFTPKMYTIMNYYTNFIPSYPPYINKDLSENTKVLTKELTEIIFDQGFSEASLDIITKTQSSDENVILPEILELYENPTPSGTRKIKITDGRSTENESKNEDVIVDSDKDAIVDSDKDIIGDSDKDVIVDSDKNAIVDSDKNVIVDSDKDIIGDSDKDVIVDSDKSLTKNTIRELIKDIIKEMTIAGTLPKEEVADISDKEEVAVISDKEEVAVISDKEEVADISDKEEIADISDKEPVADGTFSDEIVTGVATDNDTIFDDITPSKIREIETTIPNKIHTKVSGIETTIPNKIPISAKVVKITDEQKIALGLIKESEMPEKITDEQKIALGLMKDSEISEKKVDVLIKDSEDEEELNAITDEFLSGSLDPDEELIQEEKEFYSIL